MEAKRKDTFVMIVLPENERRNKTPAVGRRYVTYVYVCVYIHTCIHIQLHRKYIYKRYLYFI